MKDGAGGLSLRMESGSGDELCRRSCQAKAAFESDGRGGNGDTRRAMSQENVELARRAFDAFNRRDLDAFLALMDADVRAVPFAAAIEGDYLGHDGIRRWWENLLGVFPDFKLGAVEVRDFGDMTVASVRNRGRATGSDILMDRTLWQVAEWRDGKAVWWSSLGSEAEALAAVGLRE
jgi:ketosteroid isomerase-like protein